MFERVDSDALPLSMRLSMAQAEIATLSKQLAEAKRGLERLYQAASSMPDAGLTPDDPRYDWWFGPLLEARDAARATLDRIERGEAKDG